MSVPNKDFIISIDMGGTKILACALNSKRKIFARLKRQTTFSSNNNEYVKILKQIIDDLVKKNNLEVKNLKAVCIGIPGSVNPYTGRIGLAPNLNIKNFFIKDSLQKIIPYPVLIENDVNFAALGIQRFELDEKSKNILVVFVGTGIGGALIFDGKIYRGSNFTAGEIGHRVVEANGPKCGCGNRGCLEAVASRTAIARNILRDIKSGKKSKITKLLKSDQKLKSKTIAAGVKAKDKIVIKHVENACQTIGRVIADITNLLDFDTIVFGGGLIEALDKFMIPIIKSSFKENVLKDSAKGMKIIATKLGDDAPLYGGIPLAEEFLKIKV